MGITTNNDQIKNYNIRLMVTPNPSSNSIEVSLSNSKFKKISTASMDGKTVLNTTTENRESLQIDVSNFANGLYNINVIDKEGLVYNQKFIKN